LSEEETISKKNEALKGNVNIHCFVCGSKVSVEGKTPGDGVDCHSCQTTLTVPDEEVLKKLASFSSFTEIGTSSAKQKKEKIDVAETLPEVKTVEKEKSPTDTESSLGHKIFCDGCTAKIDVSEQPLGARFSCPACGMVLQVPEKKSTDDNSKVSITNKEAVKETSTGAKAVGPTDAKVVDPTKLKINCPTCGAKIDVTHEEAFKKVNCPACNGPFKIPKRFNHFLLEERLGENAHFSVYRALDLTLSREVCLKVMSKECSSKKNRVDKFLTSAGKIVLVSDPNIVPIYSSGEHEGLSFVVMQYMSALSLDRYLEKAKGLLPLKSVYRCMKQAAKGLQSAVKQGISHNNISLKNILVDSDGNIKVSDFEYNYLLFQQEENKELVSFFNPLYLSPKMVSTKENDLAGDIYSFGAVFYHLITGVPPFPGNTPQEILTQRADRTPVAPFKMRREIPEEISEFIMKIMSSDVGDRPASFDDVVKQLDSLLTTSSGVPKPGGVSGSSSQTEIMLPDFSDITPEARAPEAENKKPTKAIIPLVALVVILASMLFLMKSDPVIEPEEVPGIAVVVPVTPVDVVEPIGVTDTVDTSPENTLPADAPIVQRGYPVKVDSRIAPAGISFKPYGVEIIEYMEQHTDGAYTQEVDRIKILRSTKSYLETLLKFLPYEGKIYVKGQQVIEGQIIAASVKTVTLLIADDELTISWNRFEFSQFLDIIEFYIDKKKNQLENSPADVVEAVKKDIADDYFRAALLGDWYKEIERNSDYVKNCLEYNPAMRLQVEAFLPSISE
jgi:hypothetical protein